MRTSYLTIILIGLVLILSASAVSASNCTPLFFDDFTGTALDTSLWSVFVDINGDYHKPDVADGLLHSQRYHTRIDSIHTFAAPETGQSVMARASIRLAGEIQKFGFAPNPNERDGPITGYYFDTLSPLDPSPGREHYVRALAWSSPGLGSIQINLLDVEIPVTWYEFHEFAIERTPSEVIFSIDGQEVARVTDAFGGALSVGVWNDRWSLMQTDWVDVCRSEPPCPPVSIDSLTAYPLVVPLGNAVNFEATIVDGCGEIDALWDFDDGTVDSQTNVTSPVTTNKTYASAGVYTVVLTVSDDKVDVGDNIMVVVYDPTGGFVTGGGWIDSLAGAYTPNPSLTDKANFGFVSKYKKGASVPTGNTEFVFKAGDLNFHSTSYDWLVVTGSNYARFKGTGTINGSGEYRFMLWAGDDPDMDTFRIKIWTEDEEGIENVVYDNGFDQGILGGNIVIHN